MLTATQCLADPQAGGKGRRLAQAAEVTTVPPFVVVPSDWLATVLADRALALEHAWHLLCHRGAAGLPEAVEQIATVLGDIGLTDAMRRDLNTAIEEELAGTLRFAVRSSASTEDSGSGTEAGVYESLLDLAPESVAEAVVCCWRSYYSDRALAQRLARRQPWRPPEMAVVVQQMITAESGGVAFSRGRSTVLVESVDGSAASLVGGYAVPLRTAVAVPGRIHPAQPWQGQLVNAVGRLRQHASCEVDVEWAWDGVLLHVVQVRPVTAAPGQAAGPFSAAQEPVVRTKGVYSDEETPGFTDLGAVERIYDHYRRKRKVLQDTAARQLCAAGIAVAVQFNDLGIRSAAWAQLLERFPGQVVVDVSDEIRQIIVDITDLTATLQELHSTDADPTAVHTVVVREFITGTAGALSRVREGVLHVEYSTAGLLAINRGLVPTTHLCIDSTGTVAGIVPDDWHPATLFRIRSLTEIFTQTCPDTVIEWTVVDGHPHAIDYSRVHNEVELWLPGQRVGVLSRGTCTGPAVVVGDELTGILERASVAPIVSVAAPLPVNAQRYIADLHAKILAAPAPPVVVVDHPYAILAVLIGTVAGFVFRTEASLLCHLMILLREHAVPAVAAPGVQIADGYMVTLRPDGTLHMEGM
ncbi:PEP/pyruvate-binding domain-containing protein [Nocardia sp. NPDC088792]|uniref:PEP/pyruvate-binding domain-containing protein n=1 Tax=Nocardia sp. NPDC088792 TaxID=3364332 RepID=UPI0037FFFEB5